MASIITINEKELVKDFVKKFNYKKYTFVLLSSDIVTEGKYNNVWPMNKLLPPSKVLVDIIDGAGKKAYKEKYRKYLNMPESLVYVMMILHRVAIDNGDVVLVCSEGEEELKYMKIFKDFLGDAFGTPVYKYKDYAKNPDKCEISKDVKKLIKGKIDYICENIVTEEDIQTVMQSGSKSKKNKKKKKK